MRRELMKALICHELPSRVGLNEHFWPFLQEKGWAAQGYPAGVSYSKFFNLDQDCAFWLNLPEPDEELIGVVAEDEESITRRNGWGASIRNWKSQAGTPEHIGFLFDSPDKWFNNFRPKLLNADLYRNIDIAQIKAERERLQADDRYTVYSCMFIFEMMRATMGDVNMLENLLLEPEMIHDYNQVITDLYIKQWEYVFKHAGLPDGMHIYEDLGYTRSAFISPELHREMVYPYHKQFFDFFKSYNLPVTMHTCGDFRVHLPAIIDSGVDCIQTLEAKTGMNVVDLAREYGNKVTFMGNIDITVLETNNRDLIKEEVLSKLNAMREMQVPYVFMSDHSISNGVDLSSYQYMLELFWANCSY